MSFLLLSSLSTRTIDTSPKWNYSVNLQVGIARLTLILSIFSNTFSGDLTRGSLRLKVVLAFEANVIKATLVPFLPENF